MAVTHILFDFFGTLVDYSPSRTDQGYERSHAILRQLCPGLPYEQFLARWSEVSAEFDRLSDIDDHEFSMTDAGMAFLESLLGREPALAEVDTFVTEYVREWSAGVTPLPGIGDFARRLAGDYRLAVVTNTHQPDLVPGFLSAMGISPLFDAVITSVEVGWRKPHPKIYATALDALGISAAAAVFVGDTFGPDFEGPERAGIRAFLIDPQRRAAIPDARRLMSVFGLPGQLLSSAGDG